MGTAYARAFRPVRRWILLGVCSNPLSIHLAPPPPQSSPPSSRITRWRAALTAPSPDRPPPIACAGAPPPGTSRFRCKYPGCRKLYASTDAVRKHCRKRHLEWLRQIDRFSAHERGTPKPALYCVWGDDEMRL